MGRSSEPPGACWVVVVISSRCSLGYGAGPKAAAHTEEPGVADGRSPADKHNERACKEVGRDDVEKCGEPEEESEPADVADCKGVQDQRPYERREVCCKHGPEG